jgi:serine/tyrosine/threonine adenylyltransferase
VSKALFRDRRQFDCRRQFPLHGRARNRLVSGHEDGDIDLVRDLLQAMHENAADFTLTFRRLCAAAADETAHAEARVLFANAGAYDIWAVRWRSRLVADGREPNARAQAMRAWPVTYR